MMPALYPPGVREDAPALFYSDGEKTQSSRKVTEILHASLSYNACSNSYIFYVNSIIVLFWTF